MSVHAGIVAKVIFPDVSGERGCSCVGICEFTINDVVVNVRNGGGECARNLKYFELQSRRVASLSASR